MKTLLTYVLVASMGLVTTYSIANAQGERKDYVTSLESLPLENDDFVVDYDHALPIIQIAPKLWFKKKQSLIYYINNTEVIEAAISHKDFVKYWESASWASLNPGKDKLNGLFYQAVNFRNARMNMQEIKVQLAGKHEFSPNAKASIKLPFRKQEIGEYHHHLMCGAFAVFR